MTPPTQPQLRSLEIIPIRHKGEDMLLLRDRQGFAPDAAVPRALAPLLALFDGHRNASQIAGAYALRGGEMLPIWFIEKLIADLDAQLLLDSPHFEAHREKTQRDFAESPVRPAAHAGASYPAEAAALSQRLEGFFHQATLLDAPPPCYAPGQLRGIMVPHIDFTRGGPVEALAYQALANQQFDVFVVLGIAHCGVHYPFCGAAKDYHTPLGTARADHGFVAALEARVGERFLAEQFAHKSEHSVEFVAVFLQHLPHLRQALQVPILCGGFHREVAQRSDPLENPDIAQFVAALRDTVREWEARGQRVGLIASVDLAHVGSRFGDDEALTPARLRGIEHADREFLATMEAGDLAALHGHIARDNNARNVDAHPALFTALAAFPELRGQLLHYARAYDEDANSLVSFASMALYADG